MNRPDPGPAERGPEEVVADIERADGVSLRLRICEYKGRKYIDLRVHEGGFPTRKGVAIRMTEVEAIRAALATALEKMGGQA